MKLSDGGAGSRDLAPFRFTGSEAPDGPQALFDHHRNTLTLNAPKRQTQEADQIIAVDRKHFGLLDALKEFRDVEIMKREATLHFCLTEIVFNCEFGRYCGEYAAPHGNLRYCDISALLSFISDHANV